MCKVVSRYTREEDAAAREAGDREQHGHRPAEYGKDVGVGQEEPSVGKGDEGHEEQHDVAYMEGKLVIPAESVDSHDPGVLGVNGKGVFVEEKNEEVDGVEDGKEDLFLSLRPVLHDFVYDEDHGRRQGKHHEKCGAARLHYEKAFHIAPPFRTQ